MTKTTTTEPSSKRGRPAGLAVEDFAHRKGVTKALQGYRERKEKKRVHTAKALRHYKKVMKQEGYEPGQGASRKRLAAVAEESTSTTSPNNDMDVAKQKVSVAAVATSDPNNRMHRKPRTHLFQKSIQKADQHWQQIQQSKQERERGDKERREKLKQRRNRTKLLSQRTRKGQPIMKNLVKDILHKLEREQK